VVFWKAGFLPGIAAKWKTLLLLKLHSSKYVMRITEIIENSLKPIKPKPPLTPAQARVAALKQNVAQGRLRLQQEKDRQRQQSSAEQQRKQRLRVSQSNL